MVIEIKACLDKLDRKLSQFQVLRDMETKFKVPKLYVVGIVLFILVVLLVFNIGGSCLSTLVGFIYPAYLLCQLIETKSSDDLAFIGTYWISFGFIIVVESCFSRITRIPLYYLMKSIVFLWLYLPSTKGSLVIYSYVIQPFYSTIASTTNIPRPSTSSRVMVEHPGSINNQ